MATPIYKACDQRLRLMKTQDVDGNYLNSGTVAFSLTKRSDGTELSAGALPYIVASNGNYWATIDKIITADIEVNEWYDFEVVYVDGDGNDATFHLECYGALKR